MNSGFALPKLLRLRTLGLPGRHLAFFVSGTCLAAMVAVLLSPSVVAKSRPTPAILTRSDPSYILALSAANRFLQAWQNQDHETGLLMLTDDAKRHSSEDGLDRFFSSGSDTAYEIARGKRLKSGRYAFPVTLFASDAGTQASHPQKSAIVVVRTGKNEWAIDKLP